MCLGLGGCFMAVVLAAAIYSRIGSSLCLAVRAWRVRVPGGSLFHLEPGTINNIPSTPIENAFTENEVVEYAVMPND